MRSQHIWTERNEDGRRREVRATKFGGVWRLQAKTAGELDWTYYPQPLREDLQSLKEILVRKYQRRRASAEDVASVERLIADQGELDSRVNVCSPCEGATIASHDSMEHSK